MASLFIISLGIRYSRSIEFSKKYDLILAQYKTLK